jgi:hypothetical protein
MSGDLLATRLAARLRLPFVAVGGLSAVVAIANLFSLAPDSVTIALAFLVAAAGGSLFFCEVFDGRFHNALSALNAEFRQKARAVGWSARLFGLGLPIGDKLPFVVGLLPLATALVAAEGLHKLPPTVLAFAGFWLICITQIALMVRGYPDDRFVPYF